LIPVLSWGLWYMLSRLLWLAYIALLIFMMYKTFSRQKVSLPAIGELAEKHS